MATVQLTPLFCPQPQGSLYIRWPINPFCRAEAATGTSGSAQGVRGVSTLDQRGADRHVPLRGTESLGACSEPDV